MRAGRARGLAAAGLLALASGCSAAVDAPGAVAPTDSRTALSAALVQHRADVVRRVVQVQTTMTRGEDPVRVRSVGLRAPGFEPVEPAALDARLSPGRPVDLPVVLGAARCPGSPGDTAAGAPMALVEVLEAGAPQEDARTVELAVPGGDVLLARLHQADCREQAVRSAVDVRVLPGWTDVTTAVGPALRVVLRLSRPVGVPDDRPAQVDELGENILLSVRPVPARPAPVLVLPAGQASADLVIELAVQRCDAHALGESKRTSVLRLQVTAAGQDRQLLLTAVDDATRLRVERLVGQTCTGAG